MLDLNSFMLGIYTGFLTIVIGCAIAYYFVMKD